MRSARIGGLRKASAAALLLSLAAAALGESAVANATTQRETAAQISSDHNGTIYARSLAIPFSDIASPEAKSAFLDGLTHPLPAPGTDLLKWREAMAVEFYAPQVAQLQRRFPVRITPETMAGVYTEVIVPADGVAARNRHRVLINLHGGAFVIGGRLPGGPGSWAGPQESIRLAHEGKVKVVAVDYRMSPEHRFPAASEDVAAVYRQLLKDYKPEHIGIYGCSAGGILTAQAVAWFQAHGLPRPGAIGIFCAGAMTGLDGDSSYVAPILNGRPGRPIDGPRPALSLGYFAGASRHDPLVSPAAVDAVLAGFPPTLLITGTRDTAMSAAVHTHAQLVKLGVNADLHVWEGIGHGGFYDPAMPESAEATNVIIRFFDKNLGDSP